MTDLLFTFFMVSLIMIAFGLAFAWWANFRTPWGWTLFTLAIVLTTAGGAFIGTQAAFVLVS